MMPEMGTMKAGNSTKRELDDSGCIQDGSPPCKKSMPRTVCLLDLSDDVLLLILQYCGPQDLKALGFTCPRFGSLVQDRTLWQRVGGQAVPCGHARLRWMLAHGLNKGTTELKLSGYAREAQSCQGHSWRPVQREPPPSDEHRCTAAGNVHAQIALQQFSRYFNDPFWVPPLRDDSNNRYLLWYDDHEKTKGKETSGPTVKGQETSDPSVQGQNCPGPQFTLSVPLMTALRDNCNLTSLSLDYCNLDCSVTKISQFPRQLRRLSLRGSRCYNARLQESLITKINDHLCALEEIDLSECLWVFPSEMMPLSRLPALKVLRLAACPRLTEFVAYSSLATRFGFKKLKVLDLSRSGVGDGEASGLGWLPTLEELYLSPLIEDSEREREGTHTHTRGESRKAFQELEQWEIEEPEYFQTSDVDEKGIEADTKGNRTDTQNASSDPIVDYLAMMSPQTDQSPSFSVLIKRKIHVANTEDVASKKQRPDEAGTSKTNEATTSNEQRDKTDNKTDASATTDSDSEADDADDDCACGPDNNKKYESYVRFRKNSMPQFFVQYLRHRRRLAEENDDSDESDSKLNDQGDQEMPIDGQLSSNDQENSVEQPNLSSQANQNAKSNQNAQSNENAHRNENAQSSENAHPNENAQSNENAHSNQDAQSNENAHPNENAQQNNEAGFLNENPNLPPPDHRIIIISNRNANGNRTEPEVVVCGQPDMHSFDHIFSNPAPPIIDPSSLITDSSILNFGYADGTVINFVYVGPLGDNEVGARRSEGRPQHSNLRVLSVTGYSNVTNRSLVHLATAAPHLVRLDLSRTNVTEAGVERFKALRPDCEVVFSKFEEKKKE